MSKNVEGNSGRITIANFISALGLLALLVFFFCGYSLKNPDQNMGLNIMASLGTTLFIFFLLWLMIHAKEVENNFKNWFVVEVVTSVVYVISACVSGYVIMHFFAVNDNVEDLQNDAKADVANIEQEIDFFLSKEKERLEVTALGLNDAINSNRCDQSLTEYFKKGNKGDNISKWQNLKLEEIDNLETDGKKYKESWENEIEEINSIINKWKIYLLSNAAYRINKLAEKVSDELTSASTNLDLCPVETYLQYGKKYYKLGESAPHKYKVNVNFSTSLKNASGFSFSGFLVVLLVNVLVLFSYIFAWRTKKVRSSVYMPGYGRILENKNSKTN